MPEKAVELMVFLPNLAEKGRKQEINRIWDIISEKGFHSTYHGDTEHANALYFQPFEETAKNKKLIEDCVEEIRTEFPEFDIEYSITKNGAQRLSGRICEIAVHT